MHNLVQIVTADKKKRVQNWSRMAETATMGSLVQWFDSLVFEILYALCNLCLQPAREVVITYYIPISLTIKYLIKEFWK